MMVGSVPGGRREAGSRDWAVAMLSVRIRMELEWVREKTYMAATVSVSVELLSGSDANKLPAPSVTVYAPV